MAAHKPETSEKRGNMPPYPQGAAFAALLVWHLNFGTRPTGSPAKPGKRWNNKEFAGAVGGVGDRTVRNWRAGRSCPNEIGSIERALFGDSDKFCEWIFDLWHNYDKLKRDAINKITETRNVNNNYANNVSISVSKAYNNIDEKFQNEYMCEQQINRIVAIIRISDMNVDELDVIKKEIQNSLIPKIINNRNKREEN